LALTCRRQGSAIQSIPIGTKPEGLYFRCNPWRPTASSNFAKQNCDQPVAPHGLIASPPAGGSDRGLPVSLRAIPAPQSRPQFVGPGRMAEQPFAANSARLVREPRVLKQVYSNSDFKTKITRNAVFTKQKYAQNEKVSLISPVEAILNLEFFRNRNC
jgi:hypothetical protein